VHPSPLSHPSISVPLLPTISRNLPPPVSLALPVGFRVSSACLWTDVLVLAAVAEWRRTTTTGKKWKGRFQTRVSMQVHRWVCFRRRA
jgi:hypothetical protein